MEFESTLEGYPVTPGQFRRAARSAAASHSSKHEISIYDIPIALVTKRYLDYIDLMQELNLDVAGSSS